MSEYFPQTQYNSEYDTILERYAARSRKLNKLFKEYEKMFYNTLTKRNES
jgi:hypothetical protein